MIPVRTPVILPKPDETEYRQEQIRFAEMQMEFHARNAERLRGLSVRRWVVAVWSWLQVRRLRKSLRA
ncbi:MAG: hypothetical protein HRU32_04380 [Rhodobacteraceae bacterium]|nr:hypothetical protein [Paracoccaceae bacterium]